MSQSNLLSSPKSSHLWFSGSGRLGRSIDLARDRNRRLMDRKGGNLIAEGGGARRGSLGLLSGLLGYLLLINLITLSAMLLDKAAAKARGSRISELTIFFLSLIGGVRGMVAGMFLFRHKTAKPGFQAVIFLIMLLNLALLYHFLA